MQAKTRYYCASGVWCRVGYNSKCVAVCNNQNIPKTRYTIIRKQYQLTVCFRHNFFPQNATLVLDCIVSITSR